MNEDQNIEWKSSWHEDYLKWICGFANAHGGAIYIGIDDKGAVAGLQDHQTLMESIPNKIRDLLGIICDVNLHEKDGQFYLEIITRPYSVPVSVRGRYYYRSGSTMLELTGHSLNEFLLKKTGKTWDDVVEEGATLDDIDEDSLTAFFIAASKSGRLPDISGLSKSDVLEKLRVTFNGRLKRAALILFGKDPNRFYPNVKIKIGRFGTEDTDLRYQEEVEGNLIQLLQAVPILLNQKFLTRPIEFEGLQRIEKGEYPVAAIREMLLNALMHRAYMGSMIQLRVYDNKLTLWNEGTFPDVMAEDAWKRVHASHPRNPIIADICFKAGYVDLWGTGTLKILSSCREAGLPDPDIRELDGGTLVTIYKDRYSADQTRKMGLRERQIKALDYVKEHGRITNGQYQELFGVSKRTATRDLMELVDLELIKSSGVSGAGGYYELI